VKDNEKYKPLGVRVFISVKSAEPTSGPGNGGRDIDVSRLSYALGVGVRGGISASRAFPG